MYPNLVVNLAYLVAHHCNSYKLINKKLISR